MEITEKAEDTPMSHETAIDAVKVLVGHAVKDTQGRDRSILEIIEETANLGRSFPPGTRAFQVVSESADCTHTPRCQWYDVAYCYQGRCVVIAQRDLPTVTVGAVIRRLVAGDDAAPTPEVL